VKKPALGGLMCLLIGVFVKSLLIEKEAGYEKGIFCTGKRDLLDGGLQSLFRRIWRGFNQRECTFV